MQEAPHQAPHEAPSEKTLHVKKRLNTHDGDMDTLGIEPRAFRMLSGCDTTRPHETRGEHAIRIPSEALHSSAKMDTLGIEPRTFRMRSGCDTTTPRALWGYIHRASVSGSACYIFMEVLDTRAAISHKARSPPAPRFNPDAPSVDRGTPNPMQGPRRHRCTRFGQGDGRSSKCASRSCLNLSVINDPIRLRAFGSCLFH